MSSSATAVPECSRWTTAFDPAFRRNDLGRQDVDRERHADHDDRHVDDPDRRSDRPDMRASASTTRDSGGVTDATNLFVGNQPTGNGPWNLTGGTLNVSGESAAHRQRRHRNVHQSAGNTSVGNALLRCGPPPPSASEHRDVCSCRGAGALTTGGTTVGDRGTGTFNQSGGTHTTSSLDLANCGGCGGVNSSGTYNLSGSGVVVGRQVTVRRVRSRRIQPVGDGPPRIDDLVVGSQPEMYPPDPSNVPFREGSYALSGGSLSVGVTAAVGRRQRILRRAGERVPSRERRRPTVPAVW